MDTNDLIDMQNRREIGEVVALRKHANDLSNLAESYLGQRQASWFTSYAETMRKGADLIDSLLAERRLITNTLCDTRDDNATLSRQLTEAQAVIEALIPVAHYASEALIERAHAALSQTAAMETTDDE